MEELRGGRYVLMHTFAEGARGRTYDAVDKREGRAVVIKRLELRDAKTWKELELGEREVNVLRALSHPKLPKYYEHFEEGGALFLVMEKIEGESLGVVRRAGRSLSEKDVRRFLADASDVLSYLHKKTPPIIHRDLKPGNVIRRPDGSFAFVDFGSVRDKLRAAEGSTVVGTFGYMAPEQFQGRALPSSDVYAIGATALSMLTGAEPEDLPHQGLGIDVRAALKGKASEELIAALERMLLPDPDERASAIPTLAGAPKKRKAEKRKDEKRRRKEARRAAREARRARGHRGPPWPVALVFTLGLLIASLAVWATLSFALPVLFWILSWFFAKRALRDAAAAVKNAGSRAQERLEDAREWLHHTHDSEAAPRVRVDEDAGSDAPPSSAPHVRVVHPDTRGSRDAAAEEDAAEDFVDRETRRKRR